MLLPMYQTIPTILVALCSINSHPPSSNSVKSVQREFASTTVSAGDGWLFLQLLLIGVLRSVASLLLLLLHSNTCTQRAEPCIDGVLFFFFFFFFPPPLTSTCSVTFRVGDEPVSNLKMVERHFYKDRLLKSFDFDFGFCIPGSKNTIVRERLSLQSTVDSWFF